MRAVRASGHQYEPLAMESGTDEESLEQGDALGEGGCCSDIYHKLHASITSSDIYRKLHASITGLAGRRAFMLVTTAFMFTDQYLDGGVAVALENDIFKSLAMLLVLSIVLPQVISWAFLLQNGMVDCASLLRILLFPIAGLSSLMCLELAAVPEASFLKDVALFSTAISLEPIWHLRKGWATGREVEESFWSTVCEGLMEAPASAGFTLYPAMLKSVYSLKRPDFLFVVSSVWSLVMVTRASTKLHFYGTQPGDMHYAKVMILMKFPQVISQVIGFVAFAFLTRPLPQGIRSHAKYSQAEFNDEIGGKSISRFVFAFVALEIVMNFAILRTISPKMRMSIAALFATTMVVGGPPGFLRALDGARLGHALQHLMIMVVMAIVGVCEASEAHWEVLAQQYPEFCAMLLVSMPWAFLASVLYKNEIPLEERLKLAQEKMAKAISSSDYMMIRLLVDVEGVDILAIFDQALKSQRPDICNVLVKSLPEVRDHGKNRFEEAVRQRDVDLTKNLVLGAPALATQLNADVRQRTQDLFSSKSNPLEAVHQVLNAGVWDVTGQNFSKVASMVTLFIHCPDGQQQCGGGYLLEMEQMVNGMPLWRRAGSGTERWLYSGTDGIWHIGDQEEKEQQFNCKSSWISSEAEHGGLLPPDIQSWKYSDSDKVVRFSSPGLKITTEFPAHPAALFVRPAKQDYPTAAALSKGQRVVFEVDSEDADFSGCPGAELSFSKGDNETVWGISGNGKFVTTTSFKSLWAPVSALTGYTKDDGQKVEFTDTDGDLVKLTVEGGDRVVLHIHGYVKSNIVQSFVIDKENRVYRCGGFRGQFKKDEDLDPLEKNISALFSSCAEQPLHFGGEYRLQEEQMANGMPIWRRAGTGEEFWLYSGTDGSWSFCDKNAKEQDFNCALGVIKSGDAHGGLFPPDMQSWKKSVGKKFVLKVTTEVPAYPDFFSVHVQFPHGQPECVEGYWLEKEQMANGMPLWCKAGMGAERWLYSGTNGKWIIGGSAEKGRGFNCSAGCIQSEAEHHECSPPSMQSWIWCDSDKKETSYYFHDPGGDGGTYTGPGNQAGVADGVGRLAYDNGQCFVGLFRDGKMVSGADYLNSMPDSKVLRTMERGQWTTSVKDDIVQTFPLNGEERMMEGTWSFESHGGGSYRLRAEPEGGLRFDQNTVGGLLRPLGGWYQGTLFDNHIEKGTMRLRLDEARTKIESNWMPAGGTDWIENVASREEQLVVRVPPMCWGVQFRRSKDQDDRHELLAARGERVSGRVEDDGLWLRVHRDGEALFLPMRVKGMSVLVPQAPQVVIADLSVLFIKCPVGQQQCGGEYQLQTEQMANDRPLWRRAGVGEERWLYSGTSGKWFIGGSGAKEKGFNCSVGFIHSEAEHGGILPPGIQSWKWWDSDKKEWFPSPGLEIPIKVPAYPAALFVHTPDGQKASAGEYRLQMEQMANGMPLWRRAGMGEERWLYSGTYGTWDIFCQDAKDNNFNCAIGYIKSGDTHGGLFPPDMHSWQWYDGTELVPSPGLKVATEIPEYPTLLSVQSPDGQPECAGYYWLETDTEHMANGMPLWVKAGTGLERWLYSGTCGRWFIGGGGENWVDLIHSEAEHGGLLPPSMQSWKWWDSDKKEWLSSPGLEITTKEPVVRGTASGSSEEAASGSSEEAASGSLEALRVALRKRLRERGT